ncbi:hypothetical protein ANANG_G00209670 [Anguilla anguilla]|uniref:Uncharacterized protein n=1 Tax=Anguilla anguilla TaxID=7936 RepID=A0A9D3LZK6_ANGAN|nr:hypothetical protein ANANG_G00209670 [Anguilla anguilla]
MDEQVETDKPPLSAGNPRGQINSSTLNCPFLPAPYFSQKNVESGYSRHSRDPLGWPACPPPPPPPPPPARVLKTLVVGKKEESGFVRNTSKLKTLGQTFDDPQRFLTFYNSEFCYGGVLSQMRPEFRGYEMLSFPAPYGLQESGFTRGNGNPLTGPPGVGSDSRPSAPKAGSVPKVPIIGRKERSGFVSNMPNFQRLGDTLQDPQRFLTHYQSTFCNVASFRSNG